jgi:hypothetical protein
VVGNTPDEVCAFARDGTVLPGFPHAGPVASNTYVSLGRFGPDDRLVIVVANGDRLLKLRSDGVRDPGTIIGLTNPVPRPAAIGGVDSHGLLNLVFSTVSPGLLCVVESNAPLVRTPGLARKGRAPGRPADRGLGGAARWRRPGGGRDLLRAALDRWSGGPGDRGAQGHADAVVARPTPAAG